MGIQFLNNKGLKNGIKMFNSKQLMKADTTAKEGDLAVIYRSELKPIKNGDTVTTITFPKTVVFDEAITQNYNDRFNSSESPLISLTVRLTSTSFSCNDMSGIVKSITYASTDGINYIRTDTNPDTYQFGKTTIPNLDEHLCQFLLIDGSVFDGLYKCVNTTDGVFTFNKFIAVSGENYPDTEATSMILESTVMDILNPYLKEQGYTLKYLALVKKSDNEFTAYCSTANNDKTALYDAGFIWYNNKTYIRPKNYSNSVGDYKIEINTAIKQCKISSVTATKTIIMGNVTLTYFEDITDYSYGVFYYLNNRIEVSYPYDNSYTNTSVKMKKLSRLIWSAAPTQLTTSASDVYKSIYYGKNGVETGTLTEDVSNSFADINAEVYTIVKHAYDNMEPRILTDSDKKIDKNIQIIPTNSKGQVLLDTSEVTDMSYMFNGCTSLTTIPLLDTSNVTTMSYMFNGCTNLTTIPLLNTSNVTNMYWTFKGCKGLTTIPVLDTSNVTNMTSMFDNCSSLTTIPVLDTSKVIKIYQMFYICSSLTTVPVLDISEATDMVNMFYGCGSLSDESLNNILVMCTNATKITNKTLKYIGLTSDQATKCTSLSNYSAFTTAGWTTGY